MKKRVIAIAFMLDEQNNLREVKGIIKFGVFSFLPLKEVETNLNYIVHADFITEPGRTTIAKRVMWNEWLKNEIKRFIVNDVIGYFKKHKSFMFQAPLVILADPSEVRDPYIYELVSELMSSLKNLDFIVGYDGAYVSPSKTLILPKLVYDILPDDALTELGKEIEKNSGLKLLHRKVIEIVYLNKDRQKYFLNLMRKYGATVYELNRIIRERYIFKTYEIIYDYIKDKAPDKLELCKKILSYLCNYEKENFCQFVILSYKPPLRHVNVRYNLLSSQKSSCYFLKRASIIIQPWYLIQSVMT